MTGEAVSIRRICLYLDATRAQPGAVLDAACGLASGLGARLRVLAFAAEAHDAPLSQAGWERIRSEVLRAADAAGAEAEVADRSSFAYGVGNVFADHLRVSDLGVMAGDPVLTATQRLMLGAATFAGGCPVLLWPGELAWPGRIRRPAIGWNATPAAARALRAAVPLAVQADEVLVVSVEEEEEARLEQSAVEAARYLALHGAKATCKVARGAPADALPTLDAVAEAEGVDLLCVGAVRHAPIRDLIFGGVTQAVFNRPSRRPTLLSS